MRPVLLAFLLLPSIAAGQARVVVTDSLGNRVAFAWVQAKNGVARAADDSGRVTLEAAAGDSLQVTVRRVGYTPFEGNIGRDAGLDAFRAIISPLPQALERISITVPQENRLYRAGFYTRQDESFKIGTPARFLSPEAIEARPASRTSQLLEGISFLTVRREFGKAFLQGRGRCAATLLLDGRRQRGMVDEVGTVEGEGEIARRARMMTNVDPEVRVQTARRDFITERQSIDDLISPGTIAGIEVYASANQAPVEFRNQAMTPSCALVVIWTGPRQ
jgi:hypothetical protein